jgi:hypothetical protein
MSRAVRPEQTSPGTMAFADNERRLDIASYIKIEPFFAA